MNYFGNKCAWIWIIFIVAVLFSTSWPFWVDFPLAFAGGYASHYMGRQIFKLYSATKTVLNQWAAGNGR